LNYGKEKKEEWSKNALVQFIISSLKKIKSVLFSLDDAYAGKTKYNLVSSYQESIIINKKNGDGNR
jgi:hypothetical protein